MEAKRSSFQPDVADAEQVESAAAQIEAEFGHIDVWINNAMTSVFSPIKQITPEDFPLLPEVTYLGDVYGTIVVLKTMLPRDLVVYCAGGHRAGVSRHFVAGREYREERNTPSRDFCDSLWCELLHDNSNVKVTMVQMPALNTPQFGWVKSRLPRKAQPVPPIFQPEVAAEAIYFAAHNPRREFYVGLPTVKAIVADKLAPGLLDRYLARTGYDSQQYDGAEDPNRPDNLWQPVPGDHGAHGAFDARAAKLEPAIMDKRTPRVACAGCRGARHFRPSRALQKQTPVAGIDDARPHCWSNSEHC